MIDIYNKGIEEIFKVANINCPVCNKGFSDQIVTHLSEVHGMALQEFIKEYPGAPYFSTTAKTKKERTVTVPKKKESQEPLPGLTVVVKAGSKTFSIRTRDTDYPEYVPDLDEDYILPEALFYVADGLLDGHVYLFGETGLGKTDGVYQLAARINQPIKEINTTGDTDPEDFIGYLSAKDGDVFYKDGVILEAMQKGFWLLIDEIDYASPRILSILNNIMQFGFIYIPEKQERVYSHENFRIIGTANTNGAGDNTGFYAGTNLMNRALIDRFETIVEMEFPRKEDLAKIIKGRVGEFSSLDQLLTFTDMVRKAVENGQIYTPFGIRSILKIARKLRKNHLSAWECISLSFANATDSTTKSVLKGLSSRAFGG